MDIYLLKIVIFIIYSGPAIVLYILFRRYFLSDIPSKRFLRRSYYAIIVLMAFYLVLSLIFLDLSMYALAIMLFLLLFHQIIAYEVLGGEEEDEEE